MTPAALRDLDENYDWYERKQVGLGEDFIVCVNACVQSICRNPLLRAPIFQEYRMALVGRFPYAVLYEVADQTVRIHAVYHTSMDTKTWQARLS